MVGRTGNLAAYVETAPGLEEVAWLEVRRRFPQAQFRKFLFARDERGIAVFDVAARPADLFTLRTADSVFLTGAFLDNTTRGYRDLRELQEQITRSGDFGGAVNAYSRHRRRQVRSYRLIVRTYGKHEYDRQAVRRAVIQSVEQLYPDWVRTQQDPELELWANVLGSAILVGLRVPAPSSRQPAKSPGDLSTSVAEALVLLSDPEDGDRFLDPFVEGGAIIAARSAYPASLLLGGLAAGEIDLAVPALADSTSRLHFVNCNVTRLPLRAASVNKVATRFPLAPGDDVARRYVPWLQELQRVLQPGGSAVVLTRAFEQFKDAIREAPQLQIRGGYSVTVGGEWSRIYLIQRLDSSS